MRLAGESHTPPVIPHMKRWFPPPRMEPRRYSTPAGHWVPPRPASTPPV